MSFLHRASSGLRASIPAVRQARMLTGGEPGSGAGMGGGGGGSIRDAGGSFGKMEYAHEEQYFRKLQAEQLTKLRKHLDEEVSHHEHEIARHQEAIARHKGRIDKLHEQQKKQE